MANEKRIRDLFLKLVSFDSESFNENEIGTYLTGKLSGLGLKINTRKTTKNEFLKAHPDSHPNIYAVLKGNIPGDPILFSAHLDTVSPGTGKKAVISDDGFITSEGDTVLGADDISGLTAILEALSLIRERKADHRDIEILFTVSEEPFCEGSKYFNYDLIKAKTGYVLDLTGEIGTAAISAPSIISFETRVIGRAAHAGFAPEEGINALKVAADVITHIKTGRIDKNTTVNIGTIQGGTAKNIIPDDILLAGEIRSLDHVKALAKAEELEKTFREFAKKAGAKIRFKTTEHIKAYTVENNSEAVTLFKQACKNTDLEPELVNTFGGSDANRLNEAGIVTIVNACGMERVHSTGEFTYIKDLVRSAELTYSLMTAKI